MVPLLLILSINSFQNSQSSLVRKHSLFVFVRNLINVKVSTEQQGAADKVSQLAVCELLHGGAQYWVVRMIVLVLECFLSS